MCLYVSLQISICLRQSSSSLMTAYKSASNWLTLSSKISKDFFASTITDLMFLNCLAFTKEFNCLIMDSEYLSSVSKIILNLLEKTSCLFK